MDDFIDFFNFDWPQMQWCSEVPIKHAVCILELRVEDSGGASLFLLEPEVGWYGGNSLRVVLGLVSGKCFNLFYQKKKIRIR